MDLIALKAEINADPVGFGYAGKSHEQIAHLLNAQSRTIDRDSMTSGMLVGCLDKAEFTALTAADKAYLNLFVTAGSVELTTDVRQALRALFPAGSNTRAAINKATRRDDGSRAEELKLGRVTESDVADALRI